MNINVIFFLISFIAYQNTLDSNIIKSKQDTEQFIQTSNTSNPPSEDAGDEDELDPNG